MTTRPLTDRERVDTLLDDNARLRAQLDAARDWARRNEVDEPPLDWQGLGRILTPWPETADEEAPDGD